MRSLRARRDQAGFTLVELLVSISILGIIAFALTETVIVGLKTTEGTGARVSNSSAAQALTAYFTADAQSADQIFSGDGGTCAPLGANVLVHFRWTETSVVVPGPSDTTTTTEPAAGAMFQAAVEDTTTTAPGGTIEIPLPITTIQIPLPTSIPLPDLLPTIFPTTAPTTTAPTTTTSTTLPPTTTSTSTTVPETTTTTAPTTTTPAFVPASGLRSIGRRVSYELRVADAPTNREYLVVRWACTEDPDSSASKVIGHFSLAQGGAAPVEVFCPDTPPTCPPPFPQSSGDLVPKIVLSTEDGTDDDVVVARRAP